MKFTMTLRRNWIVLSGAIMCGATLGAGLPALSAEDAPAKPETRQATEIFSQLRQASDIYRFSSDQFRVEKTMLSEGGTIAVRTLSFAGDSVLTLSDAAAASGQVYIIADVIELNGSAKITWLHHENKDAPPDRIKAADGSLGRGEGSPGAPGAVGQPGNVGYPGRPAPSIVLFARSIKAAGGAILSVDLAGEQGGPGGRGQDGGRGGDGAKGSPASQSLFDCKAGPGQGGKGGDGGNGGPGGPGGAGGAGGDLFVVGLSDEYVQRIQLRAPGGKPGTPGLGGKGGTPGAGGPEGEVQLPYCQPSGRRGADGSRGNDSHDAVPQGPRGADGRHIVVPLNERQLMAIFQ
jgi:hypothetical protein